MWKTGVSMDNKANTGEVIVGTEWRVAHNNGPPEDIEGKMGTKQSGDARGGSVAQELRRWQERPKVVMMDKDYKEKLEMEEHVPVPKRVYTTREDLEVFGFTARCPGCMSLLKGTARQAHTNNCRRRIEEEL